MAYTTETHGAAYHAVLAAVSEGLRLDDMLTMSDKHRDELARSITWQLLDRGAIGVLAEAGWASLVSVKPWVRDMVHIADGEEDK